MPWKLIEFIWRRKHHGNEWNSILKCLREISFSYGNDDTINRSLLTEVEL